MRRLRAATLVLVITTATIVTGAAMASPVSAAPVVPSGFTDAVVASGFNLPTAMSFLPDGRVLVAEKSGLIHVVQTNGAASVVVDLTARVADYWDRGLLSMSPDPDFATNGYVYLLYPFDDGAPDLTAPKTLRLTRITMVGNTASQASEVVLIGSLSSPGCAATPGNGACIPNDWYGHAAGDIVFAADKTMYLSIGDSASWDAVTDLALRAQDANQYPGKILHVDRLGKGLPTNPFWDGNPDSVRSRVFAYGFRNPFRFSLRAGSNNVLTVGDVGWLTSEEIDVVTSGKNYGWPCYEGSAQQPGYAPKSVCQSLYAQGAAAVTAPSITWSSTGGAASVGGPSASSTRFPSPWNQGIFYADYANGWIRYAAADATGALTGAITSFATSVDSPVELEAGPNGALYYVSIGAGQLRRISLGSTPPPPPAPPGTSLLADLTPVGTPVNGWGPYERNRSNGEQGAADGATLTINGTTYASGLGVHAASAIQFAASGCTSFSAQVGVDDEVGNLGSVVFQVWNGTTAKLYDSGAKTGLDAASSVNVSIAGVTDLRLVVTDAGNGAAYDHADWANASITCGAVGAPTASVLTPTAGTLFTVGSTVLFTGQATDLKDGFVASTGLSWTVTVHHCPAGNCHNHFLTSLTGGSGSFVLPDHGDDTYLTLDLVAVDSDGLTSSASRRIDFATSALTVTSSPAGRTLLYNGNPVATPYVANVQVGSVRTIGAPTPQDRYTFNSWSDSGAATHSITVGASNATYTASYTAPPGPPPPPPPPTASTVFVSALTPSVAAVNGWGPIERDRSNAESAAGDGLALRVGGVAFTRGLGVHAAADVRYAVPTGCTTFTTQVGVDDEVGNLGSVVFQVWNGTTTKLYDSGIRTGADAATPATVTLTGVSTLRLVVTDAGNGNAYDHADWLDARFTCSTTPPPPPPPPDATPPVLSPVSVSGLTSSGVVLTWTTNEVSTTQVEFGPTTTYGTSTVETPALVTSHTQTLTGLAPSTTYQMRAISRDAAGNVGRSANVIITTPAAPPPPPPPPPTASTVFVSALTPSVTAVNGWGPIERDRSNAESAAGDGLTLRVGGVAFTRGLGVHAASDVRYAVPAGCTTFTTQVGVDDEVGNLGSVVFQVWNGTTTKLYDSGIRTGADAATPATVTLTGVSTLRLVVTDAGNGNAYDHADWLDARFTCSTV